MSFRCEKCMTAQQPGERPVIKVVKRRERTYSVGEADVPGWEVAQEAKLCRPCAE